MSIVSTEIEIGLGGKNIKHYESLGYKIPRRMDEYKRFRIVRGSKIIVKVQDLHEKSNVMLEVECDHCHKHYDMLYSNYQKVERSGKIYCRECAVKIFNSGENSSSYKKEKTKEERELKRLYPEYFQFVKRVLARDNYTCQCCHNPGQNLEVHHLDGYDWCKDRRTDDTNGITLCEICHSNFHSMFGNGGNTKEQFEKWIGFALNELETFDGEITSARKIYCHEEKRIYNSAIEFIRTHHLKATSTVYFVCNRTNFCKTIKGFHLFWYDEYVDMDKNKINKIVYEPSRKNSKKVICLTTHHIYPSITEGARKEQASKTSIARCCCNKTQYVRTKDGRITQWMYYEEYVKIDKNIETEAY